ncbi:DUF4336 domain-containing protein [Novosphingobium sp. KN65.2]|uniref:DUF4336 domain-containing protein n=1 Tax=Novosphingobium sp. KN65.2 TaxID=1478134 RepID=UPI0005DA6A9F|nr:DUF4336 domain-containing protein [Novosphingobium sp. KN65.2]CDO38188.1 conserved hypothetical protein [Novosphingobium sp. KN65.2]
MDPKETYSPLNCPKPVAEGIWIFDGPMIRMDLGPFKIPFPTRMTVVRLGDGTLWIHSPIAPDEDLFSAVDALGSVRHVIAPNSIHYWYMADWLERYPGARSYAVPDLATTAKRPFRIDHPLMDGARFAWESEIDWILVPGTKVSEAVFHVPSARTVILVDLIENFEATKLSSPLMRFMLKLVGGLDPNGMAPLDLRMTFRPKRKQVRERLQGVVDWQPEKVIMAHGRIYDRDGAQELRRAFRWAI